MRRTRLLSPADLIVRDLLRPPAASDRQERAPMPVYDDTHIGRIACGINEAIELASLGEAGWGEVAERFVAAFPAAFFAIVNQDFSNDRINFFSERNVDPHYSATYVEHYAYMNPWLDVWSKAPSGKVLVAEEHCPARTFRDTEFYNDWLLPQKTVEAASGMKIEGGARDLVHLTSHYPMALRETYDRATSEALRRIAGPLRRAVRLSRHLSEHSRAAAARGAVVHRTDQAAIVCDARLNIVEINDEAEAGFLTGRAMRSVGGVLSLADASRSADLARNVAALVAGRPVERDEFIFVAADDTYLVQISAIRAAPAGPVPPLPLALVLVRNVTRTDYCSNVQRFARHHRLTPAEARFCESLAEGCSVRDAAEQLAISENTARHRLKTIFQKTDTGRQSDLMRRMLAFG